MQFCHGIVARDQLKGIKITDMPVFRKPWFWITAAIVVTVFAMTNLPYLFAANAAGQGTVFGGFLLNPLDGNSYLAKMYQGWRGDWRFTLPYTAQPGKGGYLFLFYLFLGHLARWLHQPLLLVFHLFRILGTGGMLFALCSFFKATLVEDRLYVPAFALAALGSGLGWLLLPFGAFTSDYWVAETYPFLSAYGNPHFVIGLALLLWILTQQVRSKYLAAKGRLLVTLAALGLSIISPFGVVIALVVSGIATLLDFWPIRSGKRRSLTDFWELAWSQTFFWVLIGGAPLSIYDFWIARVDPVLAGWNLQNLTPAPPLWDTVVSLSPALLLALVGIWALYKNHDQSLTSGQRLLLIWALAGLLLLYAPFGLQRRFMMGLYIPMAGLAVIGLMGLAARIRKRMSFLFTIVLLLALPTNLLVLLAAQHGAETHDPQIYLTRGEALALDWIEVNTPPNALILASPQTGLLIPAYTGRRVIYGHPFETVNAEVQKNLVVQWFGEGKTPESASQADQQPQKFLEEQQVDYIFLGPREQALGGLPGGLRLAEIYNLNGVKIFAVLQGH